MLANVILQPTPPPVAARASQQAAAAESVPVPGLVSIVIPCYNVQAYVEAAIVSALDQDYPQLEVIAVDDGSTDSTPSIIQRLIEVRRDPRLRCVTQRNGGLSAARNAGIAHARGQYIGFLDGDDIWEPDKLARHVSLFESKPEVGLTFSHSRYMTDAGEVTDGMLIARRLKPSLHDMLRRNHFGNGSTVIARRECFEMAGVFREELKSCEDYEMWCRILWATAYQAEGLPLPLTLYRLRESSLSADWSKFTQNADAAMAFLRKEMPSVPDARFRQGHAEHYRIAAWRAATSGQNAVALKLLAKAVKFWPPLLVDPRVYAVASALVVPTHLRFAVATNIKKLLRPLLPHRNAPDEDVR
jgi:glycosyltransferase involved in cell wall biosynthesis